MCRSCGAGDWFAKFELCAPQDCQTGLLSRGNREYLFLVPLSLAFQVADASHRVAVRWRSAKNPTYEGELLWYEDRNGNPVNKKKGLPPGGRQCQVEWNDWQDLELEKVTTPCGAKVPGDKMLCPWIPNLKGWDEDEHKRKKAERKQYRRNGDQEERMQKFREAIKAAGKD